MKAVRLAGALCVAVLMGLAPSYADETLRGVTDIDGNMADETSTIVEIVRERDEFSTLAKAVEASGVLTILSSDGPFTLFAPTNDAFDALPEGALDNLLKPENKKKLAEIVKYHVVPLEVHTRDMEGRSYKLSSMDGETIRVDGSGSTVMVDQASITGDEMDASNGVIHSITGVMMP